MAVASVKDRLEHVLFSIAAIEGYWNGKTISDFENSEPLRAATERQEGLGGCVVLAHYDSAVIERFVDRVLTQPPILVARVAPSPSPAQMIAQSLVRDYAPRQATSALNGP